MCKSHEIQDRFFFLYYFSINKTQHFFLFPAKNGAKTQQEACGSRRAMAHVRRPSANPLQHHHFLAPSAVSAGALPLPRPRLPRLRRRRGEVSSPPRGSLGLPRTALEMLRRRSKKRAFAAPVLLSALLPLVPIYGTPSSLNFLCFVKYVFFSSYNKKCCFFFFFKFWAFDMMSLL